MAPATCGVACEVPDMVMPAAVIITPGASMVRNEAEFEKQATMSAAVVASWQSGQRRRQLAAWTAPTETASGPQAGLDRAFRCRPRCPRRPPRGCGGARARPRPPPGGPPQGAVKGRRPGSC